MGAPDGAFARVAADTNGAVIAERSDQPKCGGVVRCEVIAAGQDRSPLQVAAAVIGNALEWYDFIVFGFFCRNYRALALSDGKSIRFAPAYHRNLWSGLFYATGRRHSTRRLCRSPWAKNSAVVDYRA
jgi:hypothetical protein